MPDEVFRAAKIRAAEAGIPLRAFVTEAVEARLRQHGEDAKPWLRSAGKLRHLRKETERIKKLIEDEFESIEPDDEE